MRDKSYREIECCSNCDFAFHDLDDVLFCNFGYDRPVPCGMWRIGEKFSEDHETGDEQFEKWEKWCEDNIVEHGGVCDQWRLSKNKSILNNKSPKDVFQAMELEEDRCTREWVDPATYKVVRCPNMVPRTGDLFCERCKEVHTRFLSEMEKRNREE